jgi:hypothetical protein
VDSRGAAGSSPPGASRLQGSAQLGEPIAEPLELAVEPLALLARSTGILGRRALQ